MKLTWKIIIALVVMLLLLAWRLDRERQKRIVAEDNISRLQENQKQQAKQDSAKYTHLKVTVDELPDVINHRVDSLMKAYKIKEKHVERIVERYYYYSDVDSDQIKPNPVESPIGKIYPFDKWYECFHLVGFMQIDTAIKPVLTLTKKEYQDSITDLLFLQRTKKFLGIKYGPFKAQLVSESKCGDQRIKDIEVIMEDKKKRR